MKKIVLVTLLSIFTLIPFKVSAQSINTADAVRVAKLFCTAVYKNDMTTAKSYMDPDDARRIPNIIQRVDLDECMQKFRKSSYRIIPSEISHLLVTVRFYDPNQQYLSKQNRWFCCSVLLFYNENSWKVVEYGY